MSEDNQRQEIPHVLSQLTDLIMELPTGEQYALLEELRERAKKLKRRHLRKPIRSGVEFTNKGSTSRGLLQNISAGGVFIETRLPFLKGEHISFKFDFAPDSDGEIKIEGKIVRVNSSGIGVEFEPLSEEQKFLIKSHLDIL
jgi:hypothetical protein